MTISRIGYKLEDAALAIAFFWTKKSPAGISYDIFSKAFHGEKNYFLMPSTFNDSLTVSDAGPSGKTILKSLSFNSVVPWKPAL